MMMSDAIRWYDRNISDVSHRYESVAAENVHGCWSICFQMHRHWFWTWARGPAATLIGLPYAGWKSSP
jgi:hypothetical protein